MADRIVEEEITEVPEIDETLERVLLYVIDDARTKMEEGGEIVPFTALVVKDNLFIESHPGENAEECFAAARHTVEHARGAAAYAFCYDGYVNVSDENGEEITKDCIIAEGGLPGEPEGYAVGLIYTVSDDGDKITFEEETAYIGEAPNYMAGLTEPTEEEATALEEETDERFQSEDEGVVAAEGEE